MTSKLPARRRWQLALGVAVVVAAFAGLHDRLPDLGDVLTTLGAVDGRWVAVAVLAGLASQVALGEQQRLLLSGFGVRLPRRNAVAVTVAGSAISGALPAGGAVSAAFTFRIFQRHGASAGVAGAVTVLSGAVSAVTLIFLYAASWVVTAPRTHLEVWRHPAALTAVVGAVAVGLAAARWLRTPAFATRLTRGPRTRRALAAAGRTWRQIRAVPARTWAGTVLVALANWAANLLCLIAAAAACHAELSWAQISLIYLAVQVLRQIPLTPGGTGLIEAGMLTAIIAAGSPEPLAAAVVLVYRLASFWLVLPLGLAGYLALRRKPAPPGAPSPDDEPPPADAAFPAFPDGNALPARPASAVADDEGQRAADRQPAG